MILLVAVGLCLTIHGQTDRGLLTDPNAPEWVRERIEATNGHFKTFTSKTVGQEVSYILYTPKVYERKKTDRLPVLYWLQGLNKGQAGIPALVKRFDAAIESGKAPPMLIVFPNSVKDSFYCDSADGKTPVESVIVKDLIPHIDATYRTIARREGRIIEGFSMGGYGAAHLGFKYPQVFGAVSIIDGSLVDAEAMERGQQALYKRIFSSKERFAAEDPRTLLQKNKEMIRGKTKIRLAAGKLLPANSSFREQLTLLNIDHTYAETGADHNPLAIYESLAVH
jgi:enterochelin esterase-like enzyme